MVLFQMRDYNQVYLVPRGSALCLKLEGYAASLFPYILLRINFCIAHITLSWQTWTCLAFAASLSGAWEMAQFYPTCLEVVRFLGPSF